MALLDQIMHEEFGGTIRAERKGNNGMLVSKALKDRNTSEYREFMIAFRTLSKTNQTTLFHLLWRLLQKAMDVGYAIGKREPRT